VAVRLSALHKNYTGFIQQAGTFPAVNNAKEKHMEDVCLGL